MSQSEVYNLISKISAASVLIPLFVGLKDYFFIPRSLKILLLYFWVCVFAEVSSLILLEIGRSIYPVTNSFTFLEGSIFLYAYCIEINTKFARSLIKGLYAIFFIVCLYAFVLGYGIQNEDSFASTCEAVFIMLIAVYYNYSALKSDDGLNSKQNYFFWINTGALIYFSTNVFLFWYSTDLENISLTISQILWSLNLIISVTANILYTIGIFKSKWHLQH